MANATMRLSDAIATGRVTIEKLEAGLLKSCVLGMALNAIGRSDATDESVPCKVSGYAVIQATWPWTSTRIRHPLWGHYEYAYALIYQLFDDFVMKRRMTLDELIDWVRSVEPAEPEPAVAESLQSTELVEK
jgi:hypothetical protein